MGQYDQIAATATSYDYATAAQTDRGSVPGEIESLRNEIQRYAVTIDDLYARLNPVLKPEYDDPDKAMSHPSPIVSEIATLRSLVAENTSRLQALLSRIDL